MTQTAGDLDATIRVDVRATLPPGLEQPGDKVGRYKLLELLGEGGFGNVWRAEQFEPIHREVALKVIKAGMDSREIIARFAAERQALAMMDHPNIAAVLDAGATEGGRPFFVMELVKGMPLTEFCDARKLTIRERLELFIPVCQAVQHAHQKAILHRDLKPSNILVIEVDGKAVPKVIDFGIAKALGGTEEQAFQASLARTQAGMIIGTPQYMSPEQAGAEPDLDTRSDIYTLGVILYELLVGDTPLGREQMRKAAKDEIMRLVREAGAKRPSSRFLPVTEATQSAAQHRLTDTRRLTNALRGDLDWIVLKALEKDRDRRYETADALVRDIVHHLNNEPVEAGPPSATYRLRKFVRKNQLAVGAAAAMLSLLIAGIAVSTWQKERADEEAAISQAIIEFLQYDLLSQASNKAQADMKYDADSTLTVLEALKSAAERISERFKGQPLIEAAIRRTIGNAFVGLGDYDRAIEQLEKTLELHLAELGPETPDTLLSMNNLADAYRIDHKFEQALPLFEHALKLMRAKLGPEHLYTLLLSSNLALAYQADGKLGQALPLFEETYKLRKTRLGAEHPDTLSSMNNLATAYRGDGRLGQALPLFEDALNLRKAKLGTEHPDTLLSMNNLAGAYRDDGRLDQALLLYEETLKLRRSKLEEGHPVTLLSMNNLASAYKAIGKLDQALPLYKEMLNLSKARLGTEHPDTLVSKAGLGSAYAQAKRYADAEPLLIEAHAGLSRQKGRLSASAQSWLRKSMMELAVLYTTTGKLGQAAEWRQKLADFEQVDASKSPSQPPVPQTGSSGF